MKESYSHISKVAIYGSTHKVGFADAASELISVLLRNRVSVFLDDKVYVFLSGKEIKCFDECKILDFKDLQNVDMVFSLGGDGTFLKTALAVGALEIPILGINLGHLGFLSDVTKDEIESAVTEVLTNGYTTENRSLLQIQPAGTLTDSSKCVALNEVVVSKQDSSAMIKVNANVNGEYLCTYRADGLIVSTPTGSTAYAMSVGASIVDPESKVVVMAPVSPHTLNQRPIIIPDDRTIELQVTGRCKEFMLSLDGRSYRCPIDTKISIKKSVYKVMVAKRKGRTYFQTLRDKLMWGMY